MPHETPRSAVAKLNTLAMKLDDRRPGIIKASDYYEGDQSLDFASKDVLDWWDDRFEGFSDNWVQVVADAPTERLEVVGFRPHLDGASDTQTEAAARDLWRLWMESEADAESDMAFLEAVIGRRANILVWRDPAADMPLQTFEHPAESVVGYVPGSRRRAAAAKVWRADGGRDYATLYLPDVVYKFERAGDWLDHIDDEGLGNVIVPGVDGGGWEPREVAGESWPIRNPFGEVPMVEMPNRPRLVSEPLSDVLGVIHSQDAINLMWAYVLNAADFASLPARAMLGAKRPTRPVLDENGQPTGDRVEIPLRELEKFKSNRLTWIEDKDAKIDEWSAASLAVFTDVIQTQVGHIASQTRTPAHYFATGSNISNISGDAMKALETGLVKRTEEKQKSFGRAIREAQRLMAKAWGRDDLADAIRIGQVAWKNAETRSEAQLADALLKKHKLGWPFEALAREWGLSPTEVADLVEMRNAEMRMSVSASMDAALGLGDTDPPPDADEE